MQGAWLIAPCSFGPHEKRQPLQPLHAGTIEVDAHTAMLTLSVFLFLSFPFGIATASTIRVGNLLGAGQPDTAKVSGEPRAPMNELILPHLLH